MAYYNNGCFTISGESGKPFTVSGNSGITYGTLPQGVSLITTPLQIQEDEKYMNEILFNVTVVGTDREILLDKKVVASNQDNAKFVSGVYELVKEKGLTLDDVTVLVTTLGTVKINKEK